MSVAPLASKSKLSDENQDGVPSDAFCAEVSQELDAVQQVLLDHALKMYPDPDASRVSDKQTDERADALEAELEKYTQATLHGMNVRS